jgi:hypothetical protein
MIERQSNLDFKKELARHLAGIDKRENVLE